MATSIFEVTEVNRANFLLGFSQMMENKAIYLLSKSIWDDISLLSPARGKWGL